MQIKTKLVSSHTADSKPVEQEVNGTVILPPLVFLADSIALALATLSDITHIKMILFVWYHPVWRSMTINKALPSA